MYNQKTESGEERPEEVKSKSVGTGDGSALREWCYTQIGGDSDEVIQYHLARALRWYDLLTGFNITVHHHAANGLCEVIAYPRTGGAQTVARAGTVGMALDELHAKLWPNNSGLPRRVSDVGSDRGLGSSSATTEKPPQAKS